MGGEKAPSKDNHVAASNVTAPLQLHHASEKLSRMNQDISWSYPNYHSPLRHDRDPTNLVIIHSSQYNAITNDQESLRYLYPILLTQKTGSMIGNKGRYKWINDDGQGSNHEDLQS